MRRSMITIGAGAAAGALTVASLALPAQAASTTPAAAAVTKPVSNQLPRDARKIAKWPRMLFWGIIEGSPVTAAKIKDKAPAANSVGLQNIFWAGSVPKDMADAGYSSYVWYNTITKGDGPNDAPDFGPFPSPGWNSVAGTTPPPKWLATDKTAEYKQWATARGKAPEMVAHRGGGEVGEKSDPFPENSLAAFNRATTDGAAILETDVQWTKPDSGHTIGTPVLMHDETINRTVTCKPSVPSCTLPPKTKVSDVTKQQLDQYQLSNGENIPTFEQYLNLANTKRVGVLPEIKNWKVPADELQPELAEYTAMILAHKQLSQVIIGSFDPTILQYFKDQATLVKQTANCAKLPRRLHVGTNVLLRKACTSSAGRHVRVKLVARNSVARLVRGDNGRVKVRVTGNRGRIAITYWTKPKRGYTAYALHGVYRIKGSGNG
jgi:glycerophosphoryl diester phosphodiesterase